jgi:adenylate cyclase
MLKRLKYISRFAKPLSSADVDEIARVAAENNSGKDITGVLMASGGIFFQVIEGPAGAIDELWSSLIKDPRHSDILLLKSEEGDFQRLFPEWRMKKIDLDRNADIRNEPLKAILQTVLRQSIMIQELTSVLERASWAEMVEAV